MVGAFGQQKYAHHVIRKSFLFVVSTDTTHKTPLGSDLVRRSCRCVLLGLWGRGGGGVEGQSEKGRAVYGSEDRGVLRWQHCDTMTAGALS